MIIDTDTTITNVCDNELIVKNNSTLIVDGICAKKVTINENSNIVVKGMCNDLEICKNSHALVVGTVEHLINYGHLSVSGTIHYLENFSQDVTIEDGASINNRKHQLL